MASFYCLFVCLLHPSSLLLLGLLNNVSLFIFVYCNNNEQVWFVHDHKETIEEDTSSGGDDDNDPTIRAQIIHYNDLVASKSLQKIDEHKSRRELYNVGPTNVSYAVICSSFATPSSSFIVKPRECADCFHVLEGVMILTPAKNPSSSNDGGDGYTQSQSQQIIVGGGDTIVLPKGWTGRCDVHDTIKALRVKA